MKVILQLRPLECNKLVVENNEPRPQRYTTGAITLKSRMMGLRIRTMCQSAIGIAADHSVRYSMVFVLREKGGRRDGLAGRLLETQNNRGIERL